MKTFSTFFIMLTSVVAGALLTWIIGKAQLAHLLRRLRDMMLNKEHVSLKEEFLMTKFLAEKIQKENFTPDIIFAICPGGEMIAEWLSRRFLGKFSAPIPIGSIYIIARRESEGVIAIRAEVDNKWTADPSNMPDNSNVLLVNDISRGGRTLEAAYEFLKRHFRRQNIRSATLFCHEDASVKPKYYEVLTDKTVRFDWKKL